MEERLIDAIIFGMNCVKAQDKLLQTPKTLSLQQCLTICRHYESLKLHIQQIHPSDKYIEFLKKHHPKKKQGPKQGSQMKPNTPTQSNVTQPKQTQQNKFVHRKCNVCSHALHKNRACECPAWGQTCRKCGNLNHYEYVCHSQPSRSGQNRGRRNTHSMVSEISRNFFDIK